MFQKSGVRERESVASPIHQPQKGNHPGKVARRRRRRWRSREKERGVDEERKGRRKRSRGGTSLKWEDDGEKEG